MKSARLGFKENIFQYVLSDRRLAELESSHPELVAEARKMKAHLEAKRAKSISGKVKSAVRSGRRMLSITSNGRDKRQSAQEIDPASTHLLSASSSDSASGSIGTGDD